MKRSERNETGWTATKTANNMVFSSYFVSLLKHFSISIQNAELKSRAPRGGLPNDFLFFFLQIITFLVAFEFARCRSTELKRAHNQTTATQWTLNHRKMKGVFGGCCFVMCALLFDEFFFSRSVRYGLTQRYSIDAERKQTQRKRWFVVCVCLNDERWIYVLALCFFVVSLFLCWCCFCLIAVVDVEYSRRSLGLGSSVNECNGRPKHFFLFISAHSSLGQFIYCVFSICTHLYLDLLD